MDDQQLQNILSYAFNKGKKKGAKILFKLIAPYLPVIGIVLGVTAFLLMLIGAVYSAFPSTGNRNVGILAGANQSQKDIDMYNEYEKLCAKYNIENTWVVNSSPSEPGGKSYESNAEAPLYPGKGVKNVRSMQDAYGNDYKLRLTWGQVHAATLYRAYSLQEKEITSTVMDKVAKDLQPYFYYKSSKEIMVDSKGGREERIVYLLVEAYTIQGHYQYHYRWATQSKGDITVTREELTDIKQILPERWQRLEDWMRKEYKISDNKESLVLARMAVWQASEGFNNKKEWLEWLTKTNGGSNWVTGAMVPVELKPYFEEASQKYNIPWWFLAAVALKESSFNPQAENPKTGCYGIMQVSPDNWLAYARRLGFDVNCDRDNPRAQIIMGAFILYEQGLKNIDWQSANWKEQTLKVLTFYVGFRGLGAEDRCRAEYASVVWGYADQFRNIKAVWPVPGYTEISDYFGMRMHPIKGYDKFHEGIDIAAPTGASVVSVSGGIAYLGNDPKGYGNMVTVKDGFYEYLYGHLSEITAVQGQTVYPGQEIGKVGSTGASTGPHLHFGMYLLDSGHPIDPYQVVSP